MYCQRRHTFLAILISVLVPLISATSDITSSLPGPCQSICQPVVQLSQACNITGSIQPGGSKFGGQQPLKKTKNCICNSSTFNVRDTASRCASCLHDNDTSGRDSSTGGLGFFDSFLFARDVDQIMAKCAFPSTSFAPSATSGQGIATSSSTATSAAIAASATSTPAMVGGNNTQFGASVRVDVAASFWSAAFVTSFVSLSVVFGAYV